VLFYKKDEDVSLADGMVSTNVQLSKIAFTKGILVGVVGRGIVDDGVVCGENFVSCRGDTYSNLKDDDSGGVTEVLKFLLNNFTLMYLRTCVE